MSDDYEFIPAAREPGPDLDLEEIAIQAVAVAAGVVILVAAHVAVTFLEARDVWREFWDGRW